ncbi:hypothetical protein B5T_01537 [Alloalcanivorax dieselolei B5]|uniref:Transmembrane protein n=2 Tax=Alloalcanivorax TaxID=3020832 RepID=K0CE35_ALCDB|nr:MULTISPECIES: DUF4845 domain-containing protein [Alloalcanivorax]AFT69816.1 hypothetical protein B5T_01537 [Alloalcanivorax dieselolei B5]MCE7525497.1 DUF4845 domain-containing protein [Alloalcanivorax xenomutans]MCU5783519.1 hypothetical protein [Alloalcanivorax balearicus MACL04]GGJ87224.1 DUF4845 domain-containing protein [Alloalcanivorax dieselolei]
MKGRARQGGLSLLGWIVVLIVLAVFGTAAFRMVPAYMEYNTIKSATVSLLGDSKTALMSEREIRDALSKRFIINQVNAITANDLVVSKEGGRVSVAVDYEVREPLFYNVSVVMTFQDTFSKSAAP